MFLLNERTHRMTVQYHPLVGHLYVPNLQARLPSERGGFLVKTNAQGFRSDIPYVKAKGDKPRILFFGDSFIAGDGCDNGERISDQTGRILDAEVYNYGLSGSGTDQQMLIYEHFAQDVEADLVVICVMVENIDRIQLAARPSIDRISGKKVMVAKPYFTLDENGALVHHNNPVPIARTEVENGEATSGVKRKIVSQINQLTKKITQDNHSNLRHRLVQWSGYQPQKDYADPQSFGVRLLDKILHRFSAGAAKHSKVLIVPIPTPHYLIDEVKPIYQEFFTRFHRPEENIHVYDITPELLAIPREVRRQMNFDVDYHFSPLGNQLIAEHIAEKIKDLNLVQTPEVLKPVTPPPRKSVQTEGTYILGISCFYHNAAAALIKDGQIVAAAGEERFTRIKNDKRFPHHAINYCLEEAGIHQEALSAVVYYDNYALTFERLIQSQLAVGEKGEDMWMRVMPSWLSFKLHVPELIRSYLHYDGLILQDVHHRSHAASAFYPSPFQRAATLTVDGVGEWATATIGRGEGKALSLLKEMHFPHSIGLFYSACTQFTGFKVNNGEYKMMGLAPYGEPKYTQLMLDHIIDVKADGSVALNMAYFDFLHAPTMTNEKWADLLGGPAATPGGRLHRREFDIARSAQEITEMAVMRMARHAHDLTGEKNLCMAGGVALNCVANGKILRDGPFENLWIQPAAGDDGCALGAALDAYYHYFGGTRSAEQNPSDQQGSYWGPSFSESETAAFLKTFDYPYHKLDEEGGLAKVAEHIEAGKVVGFMSGRLEYGPRALGGRSILGDPRNQEMQTTLNLKIKFRESFRPFAPSALAERSADYFALDHESPYMLLVAPVQESRRLPLQTTETENLLEIVRQPRSDLPAITHVDYSARVQTVRQEHQDRYYALIKAFEERTGYGVIVNTSFNVRGEPIVLSPFDAYRCFMRTNMDILVMDGVMLYKEEQPPWPESKGHIENQEMNLQPLNLEKRYETALRALFHQRFLPLRKTMKNEGQIILNHTRTDDPSTWQDVLPIDAAADYFTIPKPLSHETVHPEQFVHALVASWQLKTIPAELKALLEEMIILGKKYQQTRDLHEEVEESVYIMF